MDELYYSQIIIDTLVMRLIYWTVYEDLASERPMSNPIHYKYEDVIRKYFGKRTEEEISFISSCRHLLYLSVFQCSFFFHPVANKSLNEVCGLVHNGGGCVCALYLGDQTVHERNVLCCCQNGIIFNVYFKSVRVTAHKHIYFTH